MSEYHTPVLLDESITALLGNPDGTYIDVTFGGGGHAAEILSRLSPGGKLIAFDRDSDALGNRIDDPRLELIHNNFRFIHNYVLLLGLGAVDGVIADLGVSSHQFDTAQRGFSFRYDAPLDMRMNNRGGRTAADVVATASAEELERILRVYGEVENARRIAGLVVAARQKMPLTTTGAFDTAISAALPRQAEHKALARIYQALRIEVNQEMRSLEKMLRGAAESLRPGGRLVVITYHSLEDRMVKNFIRFGNVEGRPETDLYGRSLAPLEAVGKFITPQETEIAGNTRARSAKLRVAVKKEEAA